MEVEVRRSARRRKTVSAFFEDGRAVVAIPARFTASEEREWVSRMLAQLQRPRRHGRASDEALHDRARELSRRYLGGRARPTSVAWVRNQQRRWGSCTPATGEIRLSHRLQPMPEWVVDYVLLHELAHLLVAGHGPDFWALVERYAHTERARGFLEGVDFARHAPPIAGE
ncbi:MAG TPA: M48 family metallopeptidase [Actinomycetaceae bacterium]|nr:M48 family metallopeptidase [Actinomycetaceae bacterium]